MQLRSRFLAWTSWFVLGAAIVLTAAALLSHWAINAESLGARDAGLALFLAFASAFALIGSLYASPVLALVGFSVLFWHRDTGLRFLAAAVVISIPLVVLAWME